MLFSFLVTMTLCVSNIAFSYTIDSYPIQNNVEASGISLNNNTKKWMKRWQNMDLENSSLYLINEISGTTSINLKIKKIDANDPNGAKSLGTFLAMNSSGNPNSEIAYFSLATILGVDHMFRPAVKYELGPNASKIFKNVINKTKITGAMRLANKKNILKMIDSGTPLLGCMKAKKSDFSKSYEAMTKITRFSRNGTLISKHPIVDFIQAKNPLPQNGKKLTLMTGYMGDEYELSREFSIILIFDSVFGQYDRFSGGNIVLEKDDNGDAHFVATDNGGAYIVNSIQSVKSTLELFSRYDKNVIDKIRELNNFLKNPSVPYLGYTDPEKLIVDMGMYTQNKPASYLKALIINIEALLKKVSENEKRYGSGIYF